jgi:hypothetical protein
MEKPYVWKPSIQVFRQLNGMKSVFVVDCDVEAENAEGLVLGTIAENGSTELFVCGKPFVKAMEHAKLWQQIKPQTRNFKGFTNLKEYWLQIDQKPFPIKSVDQKEIARQLLLVFNETK